MEANGLLAIIGGTGVDLRGADSPLTNARDEVVETRWGRTQITHALLDGREIVFLQRHAASSLDANKAVGQAIPPHRVNYRANIAALKKIGATAIFASTAVGALRPEYAPGSLVLLDQFIDMTTQRDKTFFDDRAVHIDMTEPYCARLRSLLLMTAEDLNIALHPAGTYVCTDGPRFETGAEVRAYASWGGDVVGMTGAPECALAREADISYAGVSIVTNLGAGLSAQPLTQAEVLDTMRTTLPQI
ncbi:MAG TPA: MTAP family purine nucleoside phosphorylase, partial [Abditibacteriaceae bacterium]|nr:MTAP family purine nucleoside phosphorylase [Abditibacteriaceae bacterium]